MSDTPVEDLRKEIQAGRVLVIVGSGVSIAATNGTPLASWTGLLENGVDRCVSVKGLDSKWAGRVREQIRTGDMQDLLSAAEQVSSRLGFPDGSEYRRWLRETVGMLRAGSRSVLEALRDLGLPLATTNYDGLLEEVTDLPAVTWRDGDLAIRAIQKAEPSILHLHGYWNEPESVVLGIRSYERILGSAHAQAVLRAVQTLHTLLFVGCGDGLSDPNFSALLAWAREAFKGTGARHYRLCLDGELADLLKLHKDDHLHPISYGSDHSKLLKFLQDLKPSGPAAKTAPPPVAPLSASRLPGRPRCFGRVDEVKDLVDTLLQPSPPPSPILGGPGVGKTTITLEALYDRRVAERYGERRFFVRCDSAASREALVSAIVQAMGIEPGSDPETSLFQALKAGPTVLALDNAETPWEAATTQVEELLSSLSSVEDLALIASIRGDQRPLGPLWRSPIRVGPLGLQAARDAFLAVAGETFRADPDLDRLLEAVDRLALAVVLLAHEAEGEPNLAGLWKRWQNKRTALLRNGEGKERLSNIEVSLDLSLNGPRMTREPVARRLLSVLAHLPDGVADEDLDALLPGEAGDAASVLRKVGLAFDQGNRLRVLAPIREYVRKAVPPTEEDLERVIDVYLDLATLGRRVGGKDGAAATARLVPELGNFDAMVSTGLKGTDPGPAIQASINLGLFTRVTGWGSRDLLEKALLKARASERTVLEAPCIWRLGDIALARSDHEEASARFEEALPLFRNVGSVLGEANCIKSMGNIALARSDHEEARARFEEALPLYRNVGDVLGEANCIRSLGDIALARSDHEEASARFEEALPLFRNVGSVLGEANCIFRLGEIALECWDHEAARARFEEALPLYRNVGDVLGEANCTRRLGEIALARSDHETARARFEEALPLYSRLPAPHSIAAAHWRLARLEPEGSEERRKHVRAAREAWESIKRPDLGEELVKEFAEDS